MNGALRWASVAACALVTLASGATALAEGGQPVRQPTPQRQALRQGGGRAHAARRAQIRRFLRRHPALARRLAMRHRMMMQHRAAHGVGPAGSGGSRPVGPRGR